MIKKLIFITLITFIIAPLAYADFSFSDWQYSKDIVLPSLATSSYVSVKIDRDIAVESNAFNDLRIISQTGKEIGYQLVAKQADVEQGFYPSSLTDLSTQDNEIEFIVDLKADGLVHNQIEILSDSQNFKRQVSVYAADTYRSPQSSSWRLLTNQGYIYNYSDAQAHLNTGSGVVAYPKSTSRYVKVVVEPGEGKVNVTGARVYRYEVSSAVDDVYTVPVVHQEKSTEKTTELTLDLKNTGIPTHSLTLSTPDKNFNRRVEISASNDGISWQLLQQDYIFSIATSLFQGSHLTLEYPETYQRYIRVTVFNEDNAVLHIDPTASISSIARALIFQADPQQTYKLYYGNQQAQAPRYDISRFFQYLESTAIPGAQLGAVSSNTLYVAPLPPVVPFTERHPEVLNIVLALLVVALGLFVYSYVRKASSKS